MRLVSIISTKKVERPRAMLSLAPILVKILSTRETSIEQVGELIGGKGF